MFIPGWDPSGRTRHFICILKTEGDFSSGSSAERRDFADTKSNAERQGSGEAGRVPGRPQAGLRRACWGGAGGGRHAGWGLPLRTHTHPHVHRHAQTHARTHAHKRAHTHPCAPTHAFTHVHRHADTRTHAHKCAHTHSCAPTHAFTHVQGTCTDTHTHACSQACTHTLTCSQSPALTCIHTRVRALSPLHVCAHGHTHTLLLRGETPVQSSEACSPRSAPKSLILKLQLRKQKLLGYNKETLGREALRRELQTTLMRVLGRRLILRCQMCLLCGSLRRRRTEPEPEKALPTPPFSPPQGPRTPPCLPHLAAESGIRGPLGPGLGGPWRGDPRRQPVSRGSSSSPSLAL